MSTYSRMTKHPVTGKWEKAVWRDDFFGKHQYGVQFAGDAETYDPRTVKLETRDWTEEEILAQQQHDEEQRWLQRAAFSMPHRYALQLISKHMSRDRSELANMNAEEMFDTLVSLVEEYESTMLGDRGMPQKVSGGWRFNGEITQLVPHKDDLYILTSRGEMYKLAELD